MPDLCDTAVIRPAQPDEIPIYKPMNDEATQTLGSAAGFPENRLPNARLTESRLLRQGISRVTIALASRQTA